MLACQITVLPVREKSCRSHRPRTALYAHCPLGSLPLGQSRYTRWQSAPPADPGPGRSVPVQPPSLATAGGLYPAKPRYGAPFCAAVGLLVVPTPLASVLSIHASGHRLAPLPMPLLPLLCHYGYIYSTSPSSSPHVGSPSFSFRRLPGPTAPPPATGRFVPCFHVRPDFVRQSGECSNSCWQLGRCSACSAYEYDHRG
jgi:hypothetical protein